MRRALRQGYRGRDFLHDAAAGAVVGVIAIPLSMALAIAVGVPPQFGLYTAIVAGTVTALFGGSKFQVTGPTAAFVVILAGVVSAHGIGGLICATLMAGVILMLLGMARVGRFIEFVPFPVTVGFTAGIAVVIAILQVRDFLGLPISDIPESIAGKVAVIVPALPAAALPEAIVGVTTLVLLLGCGRWIPRVPAPVIVLPLAAVGVYALTQIFPGFEVATINSRFSYDAGGVTRAGIPQLPPLFVAPWTWPGAGGEPFVLSFDTIRALLPAAFVIAFLAAIESLLSAVIADGMTGKKHDPDAELVGVGLGNIACAFFGGFAATGALARTAANIRFGARSPLAAVMHAQMVVLAVVVAAPLMGYLPMAALAALLLVVAWNMSEARHVVYLIRTAPRSDVLVLLTCFSLTVIFDMVIAVTAGMLLAGLLFIRRMAEVGSVKLLDSEDIDYPGLPEGVAVYEIAGPLFFGAAERAMSLVSEVDPATHTLVFDFRRVPAVDMTGLLNLHGAVRKLDAAGLTVILGGVQGQARAAIERAGWPGTGKMPEVFESFDAALASLASPGATIAA